MVNVKNLATDKQKDRRKSFVKKLVDNMVKFTIAANDAFQSQFKVLIQKYLRKLAEIVDNSIEANASKISIEIGFGDTRIN